MNYFTLGKVHMNMNVWVTFCDSSLTHIKEKEKIKTSW